MINKEHPLIKNFALKLDSKQKKEFFELLDMISRFFPKDALYADLGNNPKNIVLDNELLDRELEEKAMMLYNNGVISIEMIKTLQYIEPFNKYGKDWENFSNKMGRL